MNNGLLISNAQTIFQIKEMHVITAAHCVYNWTPDAFLVTIGDENVNPTIRDLWKRALKTANTLVPSNL